MQAAQASIRINAMSHSVGKGKVIWITFATWQPFRLSFKRFEGISPRSSGPRHQLFSRIFCARSPIAFSELLLACMKDAWNLQAGEFKEPHHRAQRGPVARTLVKIERFIGI